MDFRGSEVAVPWVEKEGRAMAVPVGRIKVSDGEEEKERKKMGGQIKVRLGCEREGEKEAERGEDMGVVRMKQRGNSVGKMIQGKVKFPLARLHRLPIGHLGLAWQNTLCNWAIVFLGTGCQGKLKTRRGG